ncbi:FlgN family protein [Candidatus Arthromitus sp. SFB-mouse-SU]|uniref:flagellar protein FlgN n=1 Tax=Candidatus Arthromitus sp. SFB-mouse TaxID=49118 RepID=UPI000254E3C9|nr:flagellar protein FlgN [Candidatus Arthromitus sp. SFB-mouse]EIA23743.1 FlgN family protein [Candidatus Arthromitus sp. SFB-1]EIA24670.1 FlgN family protein [Candidatus Arthromitus sp. SFB-2]EIA25112.1 FlgN family protein [Candidatus Arthromitus sp. SFB-3]EIA26712.1 FlgN family protein [Candidatus Arthromitus sp. SFB-5]EIA29225.1 FlgN family protein [Candidatus Arthromitus sp. SFB-co]EIA29570.1 FlgN family protein [Candidatus Arthromitus sp. SFB-4]EIA30624.1 FlgN family protein [Candidatu
MNKEVNGIILNQIKLFDTLQKYLEEQKEFIRNNKLFELDGVSFKINNVCKSIADEEVKLRKLLNNEYIKDFVMKNKDDKELYESYILLVSLVEKINLIKDDNKFLIKKSLSFTNKLLSSINKNANQPNVYTRKPNY